MSWRLFYLALSAVCLLCLLSCLAFLLPSLFAPTEGQVFLSFEEQQPGFDKDGFEFFAEKDDDFTTEGTYLTLYQCEEGAEYLLSLHSSTVGIVMYIDCQGEAHWPHGKAAGIAAFHLFWKGGGAGRSLGAR